MCIRDSSCTHRRHLGMAGPFAQVVGGGEHLPSHRNFSLRECTAHVPRFARDPQEGSLTTNSL
eukprot:1977326-Alexandrium_andersonii.AAC.1